jgi:hypothetical protein
MRSIHTHKWRLLFDLAKPLRFALAASLCAVFQTSPSVSADVPPPARTPITIGQIKNARAGWHIVAVALDGAVVAVGRTDAHGRYELEGLTSDDYRVEVFDAERRPMTIPSDAIARNLRSERESRAVKQAATVTSPVAPISKTSIDAGGAISGVVRAASDASPIQSTWVYLYTGTQQSLYNYAYFDITDSNGNYLFPGLNDGTYYLRIDPRYSGSNYIGQFYNNKTSLARADAITVTTGVTATVNVDLATGGILGGRVTGSDGNAPLRDVRVWLYGPPSVSIDPCGTTQRTYLDLEYTDANGIYTFTQLATGNYYVEFDPPSNTPYVSEYFIDKPSLNSATPISLTAGSVITSIDAVLQRSGAITGRVISDDTGLGLADVDVDAYTKPNFSSYFFYESYGRTDANGYFTITQLSTDQYFLSIAPSSFSVTPSSVYMREAYNNKPDLAQADPISVTFGATTGGIQIGLARGAQIKGRVTAEDTGNPLPNVGIYLQNTATGGVNSYHSARTDVTGVYTTTGLASGNYHVQFLSTYAGSPASDYLSEFYNNKPNATTADAVSVTSPNLRDYIDAQLSRGGVISGFVSITNGVYGDIPVAVYLAPYIYSEKSTTTNATNGYYEIRGLRSGNYKVKFGPLTTSVTTANCEITTTYHIETWYAQKPNRETATLVSVTPPNVVPNINGTLGVGVTVSSKNRVFLPLVKR